MENNELLDMTLRISLVSHLGEGCITQIQRSIVISSSTMWTSHYIQEELSFRTCIGLCLIYLVVRNVELALACEYFSTGQIYLPMCLGSS